MSECVNRRKFLSMNVGATVRFLENVITPQLELDRDFFRPPGANSELEFLTSCMRCGFCKEVCPEGIIDLFAVTAGAKLMDTPFINPNEKPCSYCNKCIEVCPTDALTIEYSQPIGVAKINQRNCIAYKDVMCDYCLRSCPIKGAIQLMDGKPVINKNYCNGCGMCVSSCIHEKKGVRIFYSN